MVPGGGSLLAGQSLPRLMTGGMLSSLTTACCGMTGFYALLSVPLFAAYLGAGAFESGLSFGPMMVSTALRELSVPLHFSGCERLQR